MAGLPVPRKDHAVAMCRFARDIMIQMDTSTKALEMTLGPDTGDLSLRIGIHSGPVTGGVLRGERARFQLFGDVSYREGKQHGCCNIMFPHLTIFCPLLFLTRFRL